MAKHDIGMPPELSTQDTAPPPLPPWLKGFLVTSKGANDVRRAGEEVSKLCNDKFFQLAYDDVGVPRSMVKPGETQVPYDFAEVLLVPGCPGSVFVALRPDNNTVNVRLIAEGASPLPSFSPSRSAHALVRSDAAQVSSKRLTRWAPRVGPKRITLSVSSPSPIERIAPETDLEQLARKVVDANFPKLDDAGRSTPLASFRVHHEEHSPAMHLHKADVEKMVADMVPEDSYRVDLERPDRVILVVVAGGSAMMSVVRGWKSDEKYHHFHIHSAADLPKSSAEEQPKVTVIS